MSGKFGKFFYKNVLENVCVLVFGRFSFHPIQISMNRYIGSFIGGVGVVTCQLYYTCKSAMRRVWLSFCLSHIHEESVTLNIYRYILVETFQPCLIFIDIFLLYHCKLVLQYLHFTFSSFSWNIMKDVFVQLHVHSLLIFDRRALWTALLVLFLGQI